MTIQPITIAGRKIGPGEPPWIVAEMSANHNRSFDRAIKIIDAAAEAGADAIKVQAFSPDEMTMDKTTIVETWNRTLVSIYREAALPWEWLPKLKERAEAKGLVFFASVFSPAGVERLEREIDPPCYKIASFELIDVPLLRAVGATGKPVILSTGMATHGEIQDAIEWIDAARSDQGENSIGWRGIALLHCVSAYPAPVDKMGLRAIPTMMERFGVPVGLSDHSMNPTVPVVAAGLGASIIEMHLGSDTSAGLDAKFSYDKLLFHGAVYGIRTAYSSIGGDFGSAGRPYDGNGCTTRDEEPSLALRRSIYVVEDVKAGEAFTPDNVRCLRPAKGLEPKCYDLVMGNVARNDIKAGTPLTWGLAQNGEHYAMTSGEGEPKPAIDPEKALDDNMRRQAYECGVRKFLDAASCVCPDDLFLYNADFHRGWSDAVNGKAEPAKADTEPTAMDDAAILRRGASGTPIALELLGAIATRMEAREEAHIAAMIEVEEDANYDMRDRAALDEIQREATDD